MLQTHYLNDNPNHFSNPSYSLIKPAYRPHEPMANFDHLKLKARPSFQAFGDPNITRPHQDIHLSPYRSTTQVDTMHFKGDYSNEPYNIKHALVDVSHTFIDGPPPSNVPALYSEKYNKQRKNFGKYNFR